MFVHLMFCVIHASLIIRAGEVFLIASDIPLLESANVHSITLARAMTVWHITHHYIECVMHRLLK